MIELFDAEQLLPRRDWSAPAALAMLGAGSAVMFVYAQSLQTQLASSQATRVQMEGRLAKAKADVPPDAGLVEDLKRQALLIETQLHGIADENSTRVLAPSQWVQRIAALGNAEISLLKIEVDRQGRARIEGMATSPQAVSAFVQAWGAQDRMAGVPPRTIELRQDKTNANLLRFTLNAHMPKPGSVAAPAPSGGSAVPVAGKSAAAPATAATEGRT